MAVLIEGISVVVKVDSVVRKYPGGREGFVADAQNRTLCTDGELVRVGFMTPDDTKVFIDRLGRHGLVFKRDGRAQDFVVVDQQRGFTIPCEWAEFGRVDWQGDPSKTMAACRIVGSQLQQIFVPDGWTYEGSLTASFLFVKTGWVGEFMDFLRHENGVDVYRDLNTGKEVYVPRAGS